MHLSRALVAAITLWALLLTYAIVHHHSTTEVRTTTSENLALAERIDAARTSIKACTFVTGFHEKPSGWLPIESPGINAIAAHTHVSMYVNELTLTPKFTSAAVKLLDGQPHDRPASAGGKQRWSVLDEGRHFHDEDPARVYTNGVIRAHREAQQSIHEANKHKKKYKAKSITFDDLVNDGAMKRFAKEVYLIERRPLSAYVELVQTPVANTVDSARQAEANETSSSAPHDSLEHRNATSLKLNVRQFLEDGVQQQLLRFQFGDVGAEQECMMLFDFDLWDYSMNLSDWDGIGEKETYIGDGGFGKIHKLTHKRFPNVQVAAKRRQVSYRWENETRALMTMRAEKTITDLYGFMLRPLPKGVITEDDEDDEDKEVDSHDKSFYDKFRERRDYGQDEGIEIIEVMDGNGHKFTQEIHRGWRTGKFGIDKDAFLKLLDSIVSDAIGALVRALVDMRKYNFFHLDIKASNLLYYEIEEWKTYKWKLNDFGTVKHRKDPHTGEIAVSKKRLTTWPYRAPNKYYDHRADVYSVGAVAFEMLTRRGVWSYPRVQEEIDALNNGTKGETTVGADGKIDEDEYLKRQKLIRDFDKCERCLHDVKVLPEALDFLNKALKYNESERLTLDDALKHPWVNRKHEGDIS